MNGKFEIMNTFETTPGNEYEYGKIRLTYSQLKQLKNEIDWLYSSIKYHHQPAESSVFKSSITHFLIPEVKKIEPYDVLVIEEIRDHADGLTKLTGEMKSFVIKSVKKALAPFGEVMILELGERVYI